MYSHGGETEPTKAYGRSNGKKREVIKGIMSELCQNLEATLKEKCESGQDGVYQVHIKQFDNIVWMINPLKRTAEYFEKYWELIPEETQVLFVAMNSARRPPTGIPFHESVAFEKVFKGIPVDKIVWKLTGSESILDSESGEIFWGCMDEYFGTSEKFFRQCFVINYCPLIFADAGRPVNIPLSEFDGDEPVVADILNHCSKAFRKVVDILKPKLIVTIGTYTDGRVSDDLQSYEPYSNLISVKQPVSISLEWKGTNIQMEDKVAMWKMEVENKLCSNGVWNEVTRKASMSDV